MTEDPLLPISRSYALPPKGEQLAVLVDVFDDGMSKSYNGQPPKPQFRFVFELARVQPSGEPYFVHHWTSKTTNKTKAGKPSKLTNVIQGMMGNVYSQDELRKFDLRRLKGRSCKLYLTHEPNTAGDMKAKIGDITTTAEQVHPSGNYKRFVKEEGASAPRQKDPAWVSENE